MFQASFHNFTSWHENSSGILNSGCNHLKTSNQVLTSPPGIEYRPGSIAWTTPAGTMNSKGEFGSGHYMEIWAWIISWEAEAKTMWQIRGNSDVALHWTCHCNVSCHRTTQICYTTSTYLISSLELPLLTRIKISSTLQSAVIRSEHNI